MEKKCKKCGRVLDISNFSTNKHSKDGYSNVCRECNHKSRSEGQKKRFGSFEPKGIYDPDNPLSTFTPRQLMEELRRRGYDGELTYVQVIKLSSL